LNGENKRNNKFNKRTQQETIIKRMKTKLKTTYHKLEFNDEIKNKLNFTQKPRRKIRN
jgi:hypothetical protein